MNTMHKADKALGYISLPEDVIVDKIGRRRAMLWRCAGCPCEAIFEHGKEMASSCGEIGITADRVASWKVDKTFS